MLLWRLCISRSYCQGPMRVGHGHNAVDDGGGDDESGGTGSHGGKIAQDISTTGVGLGAHRGLCDSRGS